MAARKVTGRGGRESLIRAFTIEGLYGYRTISLASEHAATIVIARNGSGKTTLMAALDAFLRCQFARLRDLDFEIIRCRLRNVEDELVLTHVDVEQLAYAIDNSEIVHFARLCETDPAKLVSFIEKISDTDRDANDAWEDYQVFNSIVKKNDYNRRAAIAECERLRKIYYEMSPNISILRQIISTAMADIDLVYLPTYRRIELPLSEKEEQLGIRSRSLHARNRRTRLTFNDSGLFSGDVHFGLSDIGERLSELNQILLASSSLSYRQISADIINEMLDGTFEHFQVSHQRIPSSDELELYFSRLKAGGRRIGPYEVSIPNIEKIYSGKGISRDANKFLTYFLSKLNVSIQATRNIEVMVEEFVNICNKYLARIEVSSDGEDYAKDLIIDPDAKMLFLNRTNLSVYVEHMHLNRKIPLNSLSSGEKQMISLFAKLFLYEKEKVVLIDEPELSLSIDWQRQLIVDFLSAPRCRQVIAITHSPFIFDNELEPYARSMKSELSSTATRYDTNEEEPDLDE
ncbi:AAA family ATPase [Labrys sp. 22185]|uniref:AAA family ATPase n=1 Tax=Labrys sp. 22185 TaxID=3453888 RepID=UPI003F848F4F